MNLLSHSSSFSVYMDSSSFNFQNLNYIKTIIFDS